METKTRKTMGPESRNVLFLAQVPWDYYSSTIFDSANKQELNKTAVSKYILDSKYLFK